MDRLLRLSSGSYVPLSKVAEFRPAELEGQHGYFLYNDKDYTIGFIEGDIYPLNAMRASVVIPAQPGFILLNWGFETEFWYEQLTIIAWRIVEDNVRPITADSVCYDEFPVTWAIVDPTGLIIEPGLGTYERPVTEYLQHKQDEHAQKEQTRKEPADVDIR